MAHSFTKHLLLMFWMDWRDFSITFPMSFSYATLSEKESVSISFSVSTIFAPLWLLWRGLYGGNKTRQRDKIVKACFFVMTDLLFWVVRGYDDRADFLLCGHAGIRDACNKAAHHACDKSICRSWDIHTQHPCIRVSFASSSPAEHHRQSFARRCTSRCRI